MITGTLETVDGAEHLVLTRTVPAPIDRVWDAFTVSQQLALWFGTWEGDPASGSVDVSMTFEDEAGAEPYVIDTCEKPNHLRVTTATRIPRRCGPWTFSSHPRTAGRS